MNMKKLGMEKKELGRNLENLVGMEPIEKILW